MIHRYMLEAVDRLLRRLIEYDSLFGGKTILLAGDFRQVLPIVYRGTRADIAATVLSRSSLWQHFTDLPLTINMRVSNMLATGDAQGAARQQLFADLVLRIGAGADLFGGILLHSAANISVYFRILPHSLEYFVLQVPPSARVGSEFLRDDMCLPADRRTVTALIEGFLDVATRFTDPDYLTKRTIMTLLNTTVDMLNEKIMTMLPGAEVRVDSADSVILDEATLT
eukprot:gene30093-37575_t